MRTALEVAKKLDGRRVGVGYMARCPAHDDRNPSLSVKDCDNGEGLLVHCFAGCTQTAVIAALEGLDLWETVHRGHKKNDFRPDEEIVATYNYTDEHGELIYQTVRFGNPKEFRPRYPDGRGGWIRQKHKRQVLYRLPEVLEAPIVFVVEGERDVETLRSYGFVATTNQFGAKAPWLPGFTETLQGRELILIPDNDEPGRRRVLTIARALVGSAAKIVILELDRAKDVTEWFSLGHTELELITQLDGQGVSH